MMIRRSSVNNISAFLDKKEFKNDDRDALRSRPVSFRHQTATTKTEHNFYVENRGFSNFKASKDYLDAPWSSRASSKYDTSSSRNEQKSAVLLEGHFKSVLNLNQKKDDKNEGYSKKLASMGLLLPAKTKKVCSF